MSLILLKREIEHCCKCPELIESRKLYSYGKPTFGYGNPKSKIIIIGQCPGMYGCGITGIPFTRDKSGMLYQEALKYIGLTMKDIWTTNVVKCTPKNNRTPTEIEITNCLEWLQKEINILEPYAIICLGVIAKNAIKQLHVKPEIILTLSHPAYFLRIGRPDIFKSQFANAILKIKNSMKTPQKSLESFLVRKDTEQ